MALDDAGSGGWAALFISLSFIQSVTANFVLSSHTQYDEMSVNNNRFYSRRAREELSRVFTKTPGLEC